VVGDGLRISAEIKAKGRKMQKQKKKKKRKKRKKNARKRPETNKNITIRPSTLIHNNFGCRPFLDP